ncbi:MAG: DUF1028 domain-containing protein [Actinomycetia bacterium]|nr:DUF1028 domain-containing protein [Actinomycetes bacterium]
MAETTASSEAIPGMNVMSVTDSAPRAKLGPQATSAPATPDRMGASGSNSWTVSQCLDWAGGRTGSRYVCQGNILSGPRVLDAMVDAFESSEADLSKRLLNAIP